MDQINEDEDPNSWIPSRLKEHQCLTLASDVTLLKCMQKLSQKIVSNTNNLLKDLDALSEDTTSACVEVEYCIQNLNLISTKQFMEKRVYDEEVTEKKEDASVHSQASIATTVDFVPKIKEAIREGLPAIKSQVVNFEDGINGNSSRSWSRSTENCYSLRPLPYLLGTEEFIDSPTVGVAERQQYRTESTPSLQQHSQPSISTHSSVQSSPSIKSARLHLPTPVVDEVPSDSEASSMSETGGGVPVETREIEEPVKRNQQPGFSNLQDELAARLRGSSVANVKPAISTEKISAKSESHRQEIETNPPHTSQPIAGMIGKKEVIQPPKKRNLFDDSSSESEGELFKPVAASLPKLFNQPTTLKPFTPSAEPNPQVVVNKVVDAAVVKAKSSNLFGSSDSEDDLFGGVTMPNETTSKSAVKSTVKPVTNLSDDDEHIFSSKKNVNNAASLSTKSATNSRVNNKPQSLFEDNEDVPDFVSSKSIADKAIASAPNPQPAKKPETVHPKQRSLFADSDSDEDLFRTVLAKKKEPVAELVKPSSVSPLPESSASYSNQFQSTPIQNGERKVEQTRKRPAVDSDIKNIPSVQDPKQNTKTSLLFDDDSDDEDLFGGLSVGKRSLPPAKVPLKVAGDASISIPAAPAIKSQEEVRVSEAVKTIDDLGLFGSSATVKPANFLRNPSVSQRPGNLGDSTSIPIGDKVTENATLTTSKLPLLVVVGSNDNGTIDNLPVMKPTHETPNLTDSKPFVGSGDDDLFRKPFPTQKPSQRETIPVLTALEDSEDEDLFGISKAKRPSPSLPVEVTSKSEKAKDMEVEDLFSTGVKQEQEPYVPVELPKNIEKVHETPNGDLKMSPPLETEVGQQTVDQSRIASLKLSLAKQPSTLQFSIPGSTVTASVSTDGDKILTSTNVRKPFGGVPLFGPRIPSPVKSHPSSPIKSHPPSPIKSHPPSPIKTGPKIVSQDLSEESNEGRNKDFLDCLGRQRPKAPSRRLPSRDFRRSKIFDDDETNHSEVVPTKNEDKPTTPEATISVVTQAEVISQPFEEVPSQTKPVDRSLFDDSDSSDGEIFKTKVTGVSTKTEAPPKIGGTKSNAKINSSLLGSESDDSIFSSQAAIVTPKKVTTPSFLLADSDDDDDLFSSTPKLRGQSKPNPKPVDPTSSDSKAAVPTSDPLLGFQN